jgi:hypothetical protein
MYVKINMLGASRTRAYEATMHLYDSMVAQSLTLEVIMEQVARRGRRARPKATASEIGTPVKMRGRV